MLTDRSGINSRTFQRLQFWFKFSLDFFRFIVHCRVSDLGEHIKIIEEISKIDLPIILSFALDAFSIDRIVLTHFRVVIRYISMKIFQRVHTISDRVISPSLIFGQPAYDL